MKIIENNVFNTTWEDLEMGDIFRYTGAISNDDTYIGMKVIDILNFPNEPIKEYILDLEDGYLYDDIKNYKYSLANFSLVENYEG